MPFQDPLTKRLHLVFPEHLLLQSVRFSVPRSLSRPVWHLLQCSDTFRLLADCPRVAPVVFGPVMAIPDLLFLACLHIEFTRAPVHVLRPRIRLSQHLLRTVFVLCKQPMVSSPSSERKTRKCSCEETRNAARGRCVGLKPPLSQTTMKARIGHPWRDQTPSCSPSFSILAKVGAFCSSCFICGRFTQPTNKQTKHQGHPLMSTAWVIGHTLCHRNRGCHPSPSTCQFA